MLYKKSFEKRWPSFVYPNSQLHLETLESLKKVNELSLGVIQDFSGTAASKLFDQEIREVVSPKSFRIIKLHLEWVLLVKGSTSLRVDAICFHHNINGEIWWKNLFCF